MAGDRQALAEAITLALPQLADDVIAAIREEVDGYARPLTGAFGSNVRMGVELALRRFAAEFAGTPPKERNREVYVELGRGEFREGRSLDALLSAYRVGARLSWRRIVDVGRAAGIAPDVLYEVGEAMFAYIDGLSAESTEGYAQAQEAAAGGRALERRRLLGLLLDDPPADAATLRAAADRAAWPLPATVAVLATDGPGATALAARLGPDVLATDADPRALPSPAPARAEPPTGPGASRGSPADATAPPGPAAPPGATAAIPPDGATGRPGTPADGDASPATATRRPVLAVVPDADGPGRRGALESALRGADAALGPSVAPGWAALSARRARLACDLQRDGRLPAGFVAAADHLVALVLHTDPRLAHELAAATLAPLDALAPGPRAKLRTTLRAWLDAQGRIDPAAAALGVHPQTVRYRLGQLRETLGDALDDADRRLALDLALRASARIER